MGVNLAKSVARATLKGRISLLVDRVGCNLKLFGRDRQRPTKMFGAGDKRIEDREGRGNSERLLWIWVSDISVLG